MDYIKRHLLTHEDKSTNYIICAQNPAHTRHLIHPVNTKHNLLTLGTSLGDSTSLWLSTWLRHSLLISVKKFEPYIDSFTLIYHNIYILYDNRFTITIFIPTHSNSNLMEQYVHSFTFKKFHTNTFTFDRPIHSHTSIPNIRCLRWRISFKCYAEGNMIFSDFCLSHNALNISFLKSLKASRRIKKHN